ncbi:MAG: taurine dioxygenase [Rhodospirillaceae bacterium]|nr:taurine dioxygenase [Rhodospirillaceae bacterium]|tara:strand:+ start:1867 stop:2748 length:882 start_codon:yes stop_codon:yes gene_type:complete
MAATGTISIKPLHPALGAEIRGVDLTQQISQETFRDIHDAWMEYLVLVFPDQPVTDEQHITFARMFGDLETHHQDIIKSSHKPEIFRVSNVDDDGNLMRPDDPVIAQISLAQRWHTDSSYRPTPSMGSILHGIEITKNGGKTCFTNMYKVYEALPTQLAERLKCRRIRHNFGFLETLAPFKPLTAKERAAMPPVWQPAERRHPVTGKTSLYISPIYNDGIEGVDEDDVGDLIAELIEIAERPEFVYAHEWAPHDIVIWDNRCTMHRVTPYDLSDRRVMHRTTIVGDGPVSAAR